MCQGRAEGPCEACRGGKSDKLASRPGTRGGQEDTWRKTRERCRHVGKCKDWTEIAAPGRVCSEQNSDNSQIVFDSHCHLPSLGLLLLPEPQVSTFCHLRDIMPHLEEK